jgi:hypothetical protein
LLPQEPQLVGSVKTLAQLVPLATVQAVSVAAHMFVHVPAEQAIPPQA